MAKALAAIAAHSLSNIRLHHGDAVDVLEWLPAASLSCVDLLYPDPWPKRRHWKRRFVQDANIAAIARVLRPGGELRFRPMLRITLPGRCSTWVGLNSSNGRPSGRKIGEAHGGTLQARVTKPKPKGKGVRRVIWCSEEQTHADCLCLGQSRPGEDSARLIAPSNRADRVIRAR